MRSGHSGRLKLKLHAAKAVGVLSAQGYLVQLGRVLVIAVNLAPLNTKARSRHSPRSPRVGEIIKYCATTNLLFGRVMRTVTDSCPSSVLGSTSSLNRSISRPLDKSVIV